VLPGMRRLCVAWRNAVEFLGKEFLELEDATFVDE
jgi:hypothetical protein